LKKIIKKYSLIIILVLLIIIGAAAGISYAVFSNTASQTTTNTMSALNCLNITFTSNTDSVSLANTYPMTVAEGLATTPYNFTIKNNCSNYVEYYLLANVINNASIANGSYIKVNLTNADTSSATNFASYIIGLSGSTQGTGQVVNENGYRYEGKDPNNYVSFNGELWRIIGVFDSNTHGIATTNLVKIIRDEPIGSYVWDNGDISDWPNSKLYHLLNDYFYNGTNGTSNQVQNYCYGYNYVPSNCDFTYNGITNATYRSMIQNATWHSSILYSIGISNEVYVSECSATASTGNIGLMYLSDYGYSVLASECFRTLSLNYYSSTCAGRSWLFKSQNIMSTITPGAPNGDVNPLWYISYYGKAQLDYNIKSGTIYPTLYLKADVKVYVGDGTYENPYVITE
jgi:hypothetical protein